MLIGTRRTLFAAQILLKSDPVRLEFAEGDSPLQVRTLSCSRQPIKLTASIGSTSPTCIYITFDFLDVRDGAIFEIVHQGVKPPTLTGTIVGTEMRRHGPSEFDPKELAEFARRRRYRRIPKGALSLAGFTLTAILCAITVVWLAFYYHSAGSLVHADGFNLNSMRGQANFANAVINSNNPYTASDALAFFLFVICIFFVGLLTLAINNYRTLRKRFRIISQNSNHKYADGND